MAGNYTKYEAEFRDEVAKLIVESNRSIAEVAREYGLNETTVGHRRGPSGQAGCTLTAKQGERLRITWCGRPVAGHAASARAARNASPEDT